MDMNQLLLGSLMLSTEALEEMCAAAREAGAAGAKLTGSGGGGCMIALVAGEAEGERVREALERIGRRAFVAEAR
jgi:mevalonate kinase